MLTLPALKIDQFNRSFYLLNVSAADVDRLVRFEVLGEGASKKGKGSTKTKGVAVNWSELEAKVQASDKAYQRPILAKKIEELAQHYLQCRDDGAVPAIPGAVLLTTDEPVEFTATGANPYVGLVQVSEQEGTLRVLDGQHRLLALAALVSSDLSEAERRQVELLQVPAILFAGLEAPSVVEMFVTINSKHTRLNPSLLFSLKGRQLYADPIDAAIHDVIKKLNEQEGSPLFEQVKMLGVGKGKVAQAGLAQEMRRTVEAIARDHQDAAWYEDFRAHLDVFFIAYLKEVAAVFGDAWGSRKHAFVTMTALRAFLITAKDVVPRLMSAGGEPRKQLRTMLAPWATRVGPERFEVRGAWRTKAAGGGKETSRLLARELSSALAEVTE